MQRKRVWGVVALLGMVLALGTGVWAQKAGKTGGKSAPGKAYIRVVHAIPDAPVMDIYLGSKKILAKVPYRTVSRYFPVPAGTHQIKVVASQAGIAVLTIPVTAEAGEAYTLAASGTLRTLRPVLLEDDLAPAGKGEGRLRVVHLAPDVPAIDVVAVTPKEALLYKGATYPTATPYRSLRHGSYVLEVRPSGSPYAVEEDIKAKVPAGANLSAFAFGLLKGEDRQGFTVTITPDMPRGS